MKGKIGFIGLGLIGGSIAKAIRQYYPDFELVAFDKQKETLHSLPKQGHHRHRMFFDQRQLLQLHISVSMCSCRL